MRIIALVFSLVAVAVCTLAALGPERAEAAEPFILYEDWRTADHIRGDRWNGFVDSMQEFHHAVKGHKLSMHLRKEGATASDVGTIPIVHSRLFLASEALMTQLEVEAKVSSAEVTGCAANPTPSSLRAVALTLVRFGDGPANPPGVLTGDYLARIQIFRNSDSLDAPGLLRALGFLVHCADPACATSTPVSSVLFPDPVAVGQKVRLQLVWDAPNNQFLFGLDGSVLATPYPATANARPSSTPLADVRQNAILANCAAGRTLADGVAEVGEVSTNAAAIVP
jgi:hypothetical protein